MSAGGTPPTAFVFQDEAAAYLEEALADPVFREAYEDACAAHGLLDELVRARVGLGLTRGDVARRMEVPKSLVSKLEKGSGEASLSVLQLYARAVGLALRVSVDPPG